MKINTTLSSLDVSLNNISVSTEVATALSDHLKHNNTVQVLRLSWNNNSIIYVYHVGLNNECYVDITCTKDYGSWNLSKLQFSSTEATLLTALLHGNVDVKIVKIVRNNISDSAVSIIIDCLKTNTAIEKLELSNNMISTDAIIRILKVIQTSTTLYVLDISSNEVSDDVAVYISECLKHNKTLKVLDISNNEIAEGIKIIANSMQENTTLLKLFLHKNNMFDDGVVAISECLTMNNTLEELSLSFYPEPLYYTYIETLTRIAKTMAVNTGLHTLDLSSQYVNYDPVQFTMDSAECNGI